MTVNAMNFQDASALLNELHSQALGVTSHAPVTTADFISMANTTLQAGTEPVNNAMMQVISKTIFASRPAAREFSVLEADTNAWGGIIRKESFYDSDIEETRALTFTDGSAVDQQVIKKPKVIETRFYGSDVYQDHITRFDKQYAQAFESPDQLGSFFTAALQELNNKWNQYADSLERATLANFITAKSVSDSRNIIHLLTEYNTATSQSLTETDINKADNALAFWQWAKGRVNTLGRFLKARSTLFHQNLTINGAAVNIPRTTPGNMLTMLITSQYLDQLNAVVLPNTYHNENLSYSAAYPVTYWQTITDPMKVTAKPVIMQANGSYTTNAEDVTIDKIFAVLIDKDACRVNYRKRSLKPSPYNSAGEYINTWLNVETQYTNDMTENGIVICLD